MFRRVSEDRFFELIREQEEVFSQSSRRLCLFAAETPDAPSPRVQDLMEAIDIFAPWELAEDWDPCGLQIGQREQSVRQLTVTLDLNSALWAEPAVMESELILAHHPVFFKPIQKLLAEPGEGGQVYRLIRQNQTFISAHTNLDQAIFGTAFAMLQTLFPDRTAQSLVASSRPLCPTAQWPDLGHGRLLYLSDKLSLKDLYQQAKAQFCIPDAPMRAGVDRSLDAPLHWLAVFPGSFDLEMTAGLPREGSGLIMTGEAKYHEQLTLHEQGHSLITLGHDVSERIAMPVLMAYLRLSFPAVAFAIDRGIDYTRGMAN